jgi:hypothetical protein
MLFSMKPGLLRPGIRSSRTGYHHRDSQRKRNSRSAWPMACRACPTETASATVWIRVALRPKLFAMVRRFLNWILLPALALGLLSLGTFAPISDLWDKVFSWVAFAILVAYVGVPTWEYGRARHADQSSSAAISSSDQM